MGKLESELRARFGDCNKNIKSPRELQNSQMTHIYSIRGAPKHIKHNNWILIYTLKGIMMLTKCGNS